MFSGLSLVGVYLAPSSVPIANTLQAAGQHIFSQRLKPQSGDTIKTYRNQKTMHEKSPAARVIM